MEISESKDRRIEIPSNQPHKEWVGYLTGNEITKSYERNRQIERVPPLLLKGEKGHQHREYYEPVVVSLGPYHHHNRIDLAQAEKCKPIILEEYRLSTGETIDTLYNRVFEVVHDARKCYIDGYTDEYNDEEFNQMMLQDGCFILFFIECISRADDKVLLYNEHLGISGFANVVRDIFLLENQIPFVVLKVLLDLRFPEDKGEEILNIFFNYLKFGEAIRTEENVLQKIQPQPLHLLELYRSYFTSLSVSANHGRESNESYNRIKQTRWFGSVMDLKAKGIFLKCNYDESSNEDIKFHSHCCYGELVLVPRAVRSYTKSLYLNMIAYELSPHNPNGLKVLTYVKIMKTLVVHPDDVKALRVNNILIHSLGEDYQVVRMFDDIETPAANLFMINQLRLGITKHCENKFKTAAAEVIGFYFGSPWKTVASLAASSVLLLTFLQTYFTIMPILRNSAN